MNSGPPSPIPASLHPNELHLIQNIFDSRNTRHLLSLGYKINEISSYTRFGTPLHIVIANEGEERFFQVIKEAKEYKQYPDYRVRDGWGKTLLTIATRVLKPKIVRYILEDKSQEPRLYINIPDENGRTALHYACALKLDSVIAMLMKHGANPYLKDKLGNTPFDYINAGKNIIDMLLEEIEIDSRRHYKAQRNSLAGLPEGKITYTPAAKMQERKFIPSKFPSVMVEELNKEIPGENFQEILICQRNKKAIEFFTILSKQPETNYPELHKALQKVLDDMGKEDVSVSQYHFNRQKQARKRLLNHGADPAIFELLKQGAHPTACEILKQATEELRSNQHDSKSAPAFTKKNFIAVFNCTDAALALVKESQDEKLIESFKTECQKLRHQAIMRTAEEKITQGLLRFSLHPALQQEPPTDSKKEEPHNSPLNPT